VCQTKPIRHANEGLVFLVVCILLLSVEDCHASTNPFDLSIAHAFDRWVITKHFLCRCLGELEELQATSVWVEVRDSANNKSSNKEPTNRLTESKQQPTKMNLPATKKQQEQVPT